MAVRRLVLLPSIVWVLGLGGGPSPCVCPGHGALASPCHEGEDVPVCAQGYDFCGTCNVDPQPGRSPFVPKTPGHVSSAAGQGQIVSSVFVHGSASWARLTLETSDKGQVRAWGILTAFLSSLYLLKASLLC